MGKGLHALPWKGREVVTEHRLMLSGCQHLVTKEKRITQQRTHRWSGKGGRRITGKCEVKKGKNLAEDT